MGAIHWLRTRQEESELGYWFSLVSYDRTDASVVNRAYLVYLVIFFSAWVFAMLTFFANGGAMILKAINPEHMVKAAVSLEVLALGGWSLFALWQATRRSPVVFNEQDAYLLSQTPSSRRQVVLRWFIMPWLKSAIPFWLITVTLGFSLAELSMVGPISTARIPEYATYGLLPLAAILPIQLALFTVQWIAGIYRLQKDFDRRWLFWAVMIPAAILVFFLLAASFGATNILPAGLNSAATALLLPLTTGFSTGVSSMTYLICWIIALLLFCVMALMSGSFSLSRAVQETHDVEMTTLAIRYGMTSYLTEKKERKKLGVARAPSRLPASAGPRILLWKDLVQSSRTISFQIVFNWLILVSLMIGLPLLPDLASRSVSLAIWVIWVGKVSIVRLRSDLACWPLVRQLPIPNKKLLTLDLSLSMIFAFLLSMFGLIVGGLVTHTVVASIAVILPGCVAIVAGMAAFDVIRHSRSNRLLNGSVPEIGVSGILLGLIAAAIPWLTVALTGTLFGLFFAILFSLLLAWLAFTLALNSFRNIDAV
jgi:hypothetical protein